VKFVRFRQGDSATAFGILSDDRVTPLTGYADVQAVIAGWPNAATAIERSADKGIPLSDIELLAPIIPERNVFCVGWNYLKHYDESVGKREGQEVELPDRPTFFTKLPTTVIGPFQDVPLHETHTTRLDWEVELGVVIGKAGRNISEENAPDHIFGYTIGNDISARDLQRAHGAQWFKGKSLDGTCPLGPVLITANEIPDPQDLALQCRVNGQIMQDSHTSRQIFSVRRIIAELSAGLTLLPGDVILTGTPEGIGNARTPPVYLRDGDVVECFIDGIGRLRNTIRAGL